MPRTRRGQRKVPRAASSRRERGVRPSACVHTLARTGNASVVPYERPEMKENAWFQSPPYLDLHGPGPSRMSIRSFNRRMVGSAAAASPHDSGGDSTPLEPSRLAGVMARRMHSISRLNHGCRRTLTSGVLRDASAYLRSLLRKPPAERACGPSAGEHRRRSSDRVQGWRAGSHLIVISTTERGGEATIVRGTEGRERRAALGQAGRFLPVPVALAKRAPTWHAGQVKSSQVTHSRAFFARTSFPFRRVRCTPARGARAHARQGPQPRHFLF